MKVTAPVLTLAAATAAAGAPAASAAPPASLLCSAADIRDCPVRRSGTSLYLNGTVWKAVGPNIYWLGLDENVTPPAGEPFYAPTRASYPTKGRVVEAIDTVVAMGGTMIRSHTLGVSTGNPLSFWPEARKRNDKALEIIDWAVAKAREKGVRLMVPFTDNYDYYHGGKFDFLRWSGYNLTRRNDERNPTIQRFYTDPKVVSLFKEYIHDLITHVNPYTNLSYAEDPTIFAYETGNELLGPIWGDMNCPAEWVREIGQYVKSLAPDKLFVDGTYGVNTTHMAVTEVDIFSNHYYGPNIDKLKRDLDVVVKANRTYFAGEYDWITSGPPDLADWFKAIETSEGAIGDAFWSQFGRNVPDCNTFVDHNDGFTLHYGNPRNSAAKNGQIRKIVNHFMTMSQGKSLPASAPLPSVACPST